MPRRVVGNLKTPGNLPQAGQLRFFADGKTNPLQFDSQGLVVTLGVAGDYDITLQDGRYKVQANPHNKFIDLGFVTVADGADITLTALLAAS